nr:efflux RND transporter periplasmic adaptor subunit [uncultured Desulfobacter sp.]
MKFDKCLDYMILTGMVLVILLWFSPVYSAAIEVDGVIEPHQIVEIGSEVAGILDEVYVDRGDMISVGQKVAALRSGVERATLKFTRAKSRQDAHIKAKRKTAEFAERNYNRIRKLYEAKAQPFQKLDEMETQKTLAALELAEAMEQRRLAQLEYEQALEVVKRKIICSPMAGVVMERYLFKGEYVEDKPVIKIAQMNPLNVEVVMVVSQIGFVKTGMKGIVKPESPIGGEYEGVVTIVDKVVDAASGTFGVRLEIPNPDYTLPPGLKCKVVFNQP